MDRSTGYGELSNDNLTNEILISPQTTIAKYHRLNRKKICFKNFVYIISYILCAMVFLDFGLLLGITNFNFTKIQNNTVIILNQDLTVKSLVITECATASLLFLVCLTQFCCWIRK
jgi:hypothetical protein